MNIFYLVTSQLLTSKLKKPFHNFLIQNTFCENAFVLSLLNEIPLQQEACEEHSFSPICYKCKQVQAMAGSKINWQQVTDLISFRKLKDDTYKICAKYKFESPPETKFCISNKIEAF